MSSTSIRTYFTSVALCSLLLFGCNGDTADTAESSGDTASNGTTVPASDAPGMAGQTALIPPATPELGIDTIPIRTPDNGPARYGLASGRIVQKYTGGLKGERTIIFDEWGMLERKTEISAPDPPGRPGPIQNSIWVARRDSFGMAHVREGSGWKMQNSSDEKYLNSDSSKILSLGHYILAKAPGQRLPDTVINGYHCKVMYNQIPGINHKIWVWRGIPIREHFVAPYDTMEFWIETVSLEPDFTPADSLFRFSEEYEYEIIPEPKPGEEWVPPNMRPPRKPQSPGGAGVPGAQQQRVPPGTVPPGAAPPGMALPPVGGR